MTTPQPAALPELLPITGYIASLQDGALNVAVLEYAKTYALAALQAQPAAAGVSDVIAMVRERYRGTKWGKAAECICDAVDEAILALRPQAVPMTRASRDAIMAARTADGDADEWPEPWAYRRGWEDSEAHHGITKGEA